MKKFLSGVTAAAMVVTTPALAVHSRSQSLPREAYHFTVAHVPAQKIALDSDGHTIYACTSLGKGDSRADFIAVYVNYRDFVAGIPSFSVFEKGNEVVRGEFDGISTGDKPGVVDLFLDRSGHSKVRELTGRGRKPGIYEVSFAIEDAERAMRACMSELTIRADGQFVTAVVPNKQSVSGFESVTVFRTSVRLNHE